MLLGDSGLEVSARAPLEVCLPTLAVDSKSSEVDGDGEQPPCAGEQGTKHRGQ